MTVETTLRPALNADDISAVIPIKVDSPQRRHNLEQVLAYLRGIAPGIELLLVEQDRETQLDLKYLEQSGATHVLVPCGGSHWKTRNMNLGGKLARHNILLFLDCDVLLTADALANAIETVRQQGGFVQPFNGLLVELDRGYMDKARDVFDLVENAPHFAPDYGRNLAELDFSKATPLFGGSDYLATGGAVVCDRRDFFQIGGYNENFIAYGFEDMEFFERIGKFGYPIERIHTANAYHLPHPRGEDSTYSGYYRSNEREYERVRDMAPDELRRYVYNGFRELRFDSGMNLQVSQSNDHYHLDLLPDRRKAMGDMELVFLVLDTDPGYGDARLERVFRYLEQHFTQYRIILFERGGRTLRHPLTMKNYFYNWLDPKLLSEQQARDLVNGRTQPRFSLEVVDRNYDPAPLIRRLQALTASENVTDVEQERSSHG